MSNIPLKKTAAKAIERPIDEQSFSNGAGEWKISDILEYIRDAEIVPEDMSVDQLYKSNLDKENESAADEPIGSEEFIARAEESDLSYPIIVLDSGSDDAPTVIDGLHRLWKAKNHGLESVKAFVLSESDLEQVKSHQHISKEAAANPLEFIPEAYLGGHGYCMVKILDIGSPEPHQMTHHEDLHQAMAEANRQIGPGKSVEVFCVNRERPDFNKARQTCYEDHIHEFMESGARGPWHYFGGSYYDVKLKSDNGEPFEVSFWEYGNYEITFSFDPASEPGPTDGFVQYITAERRSVESWSNEQQTIKTASHTAIDNIVDQLEMTADTVAEKHRDIALSAIAKNAFRWSATITHIASRYDHSGYEARHVYRSNTGSRIGPRYPINITHATALDQILIQINRQAPKLLAEFPPGGLVVDEVNPSYINFRHRTEPGHILSVKKIKTELTYGEDFDSQQIWPPLMKDAGMALGREVKSFVDNAAENRDFELLFELADALYKKAKQLNAIPPPVVAPDREEFSNYQAARVEHKDHSAEGPAVDFKKASIPTKLAETAQPTCTVKKWRRHQHGFSITRVLQETVKVDDLMQAFRLIEQMEEPDHEFDIETDFMEQMDDGSFIKRSWATAIGQDYVWTEYIHKVNHPEEHDFWPTIPYLGRPIQARTVQLGALDG